MLHANSPPAFSAKDADIGGRRVIGARRFLPPAHTLAWHLELARALSRSGGGAARAFITL